MLGKACVFCCLFCSLSAYGNISLSPYFLEFSDGTRRADQMRFTNNSQTEKTYNIKLVNFRQEKDGSYKEISEPITGNPFADQYLEWSPHQTTLQPGESQVVRVRRRGMAAAPDGEYVSHMLIREQPSQNDMYGTQSGIKNELTINLKPLYGVSIPIIIIHGQLHATAYISNIKASNKNGHPYLSVTVSRDGTRSFYGSLVVKDGARELGRISNFRIYMTTPSRTLDIPLTKTPPRGTTITLIDESTNETVETKSI